MKSLFRRSHAMFHACLVAAVAGAQCTWTDWRAGRPLVFELDARAPNWRLEIRSGRPLVIDAGCGPDHPEWALSVVRGDARGPCALLEHAGAFACSPATKKRRQEARVLTLFCLIDCHVSKKVAVPF